MDDALIDAFYHEHTLENRVGGTFTAHAIDNIVKELQSKFSDKVFTKESVHNRMRNIKKIFSKCYDTFQNGMSGFAWDSNTNMWNAESEVWDQLIQAKLEVAEWRNKPIRNYDKLIELYGRDRATGKQAETRADMEHGQYEQYQSTQEARKSNAYPEVPTSSRNKKSKQDHLEGMTDMLRGEMNNLANTINHLSTMPPISESEIWQMVQVLDLDPSMDMKAYIFLCKHEDLCRTLIGCPLEDSQISFTGLHVVTWQLS
uniref:Myb/SANT-like domain-containing protein n=1 Tax=Nicotiana tabacum TaxID=4097 RepID=A0A1S4B850_TOBAC|nr:PREDICTED: uncharacterized protein LOC107805506 [Nicotiana tabacum]